MYNGYHFDKLIINHLQDYKIHFMTFEDVYADNNIEVDSFDYIILSHEFEVSNTKLFEDLHNYFDKKLIELDKVILVMGDFSLEEKYNNFCNNNNFYKYKPKLNMLSAFFMEICIRDNFEISWYLEYKKNILNDLNNIRKSYQVKPKRFLSMNGTLKPHREKFISYIKKHQLTDYIDYSELQSGMPVDEYNFNDKKIKRFIEQQEKQIDTRVDIQDMSKDIDKTFHLNYVYGDSQWKIPGQENLYQLYKNYNIDIISESEANHDDSLFFTEKTLRPLYFGLPFLMIGNKNMLSNLQEMGYATYDNIFDESYDKLDSWRDRLEHVSSEVNRFCSMNQSEFTLQMHKATDNILHNVHHFFQNDYELKRIERKLGEIVS
jgi:hypothetical protein